MMTDVELETFKKEIISGYVDRYIDRLLDLRNIIKRAKNYEEIARALENERKVVNEIKAEKI